MRNIILLTALLLTACASFDGPNEPENFHKISDNIYRGAQPTRRQLAHLRDEIGIKTVINLRYFHSDHNIEHLNYVHIPMTAYNPGMKHIDKFMSAVKKAKKPIYLHCLHGSDRTGLMSAVYRVEFQGWNPRHALTEMTSKNFGYHKHFIITDNRVDDLFKERYGIK